MILHTKKVLVSPSFFLYETTCVSASKKRLKYNKKAAKKVRKAVSDFFIATFEIPSPL